MVIEENIAVAIESLLEEGDHLIVYCSVARLSVIATHSPTTQNIIMFNALWQVFLNIQTLKLELYRLQWYWEQTLGFVGVHLVMLMYFSIYLEILNHSVVELPQKLLLYTILVNESAMVSLSPAAYLSIGVRGRETAFFSNGF